MKEKASQEDSDYVGPDSQEDETYMGNALQTDSND